MSGRDFAAYYASLPPERKAAIIARATARNKADPRRREISRLSARRARAAMDPVKRREMNRVASAARKDQIIAWRKANPQNAKAADARYRRANPYASLPAERKAGYLSRNAARRAREARATPSWADHEKIEALYVQARLLSEKTGVPHEVDHVVPLNSAVVCGLHVHTNLRVITKAANRAKRNSLEALQ